MKSDELARLLGEGWLTPEDRRPKEFPIVVALEHPVQHGGQELREIRIGDLRGIHVRQAPDEWSHQGSVLLMLGLLTGLPDSVIDQLQDPDLTEACEQAWAVSWPLFELPMLGAAIQGEKHQEWPALPAPLELELETPIKVDGDVRTRITFQNMTGRIARRLPNRLLAKHHPALVEALTGLPPKAFDQLAGRDLNRALAVAECFFAGSRRTASRSTP